MNARRDGMVVWRGTGLCELFVPPVFPPWRDSSGWSTKQKSRGKAVIK